MVDLADRQPGLLLIKMPESEQAVLCNFCGGGQKRLLFGRKKFLSRTLAETLKLKPKLCASHVTENHFVYIPKEIAGKDGTPL